ncbi:MAG: CotH kinase family protein [Verrucomicrobia bacterium]|nr:CotH kinase family protein [Verrucomicrobiota bacterium]
MFPPRIPSPLIALASAGLLLAHSTLHAQSPPPAATPAKPKVKDEAASAAKSKKNEEDRSAYFKNPKVSTIDISIEPAPGLVKPLAPLMAEPKKYVKATLTEGDTTYPDVGIHLRGGLGSFQPVTAKSGFTLNMNKFDGKKSFHGMDKWHLSNSAQDGSYLSLLVCNEMLRAAGVPAPRITHAIVTLNGQPKGFYCVQEGYDSDYFNLHFKTADGNFYDGGFLKDIDQNIELIRTKADVKDWADLKAVTAAAREPDPVKRFERLEKLLDMDIFISGFCIQAILGDWDGYVFNRNNYRVYHDPKRDKVILLPSGLDQEFGNAEQGALVPPMKGLLATAVFNTPEGKARYLKRMDEINRTIMNTDPWFKALDLLQARLQPELAKVDPKAAADYPKQVDRIRDFFRIRQKSIERQLKAAK